MADYGIEDAARDIVILKELGDDDAADRIAGYVERLESRTEVAERVCRAAVEVTTPVTKGEPFQQRQTRFLSALAEWRATQA